MLNILRNRKVTRLIMKIVLILVIPSFVFLYGWGTLENQRAQRSLAVAEVKEPSWLPWPFNKFEPVSTSEYALAADHLRDRRLMEAQMVGDYGAYIELMQTRPMELFTKPEIVREALYQRVLRAAVSEAGTTVTRDDLRAQIIQMFPQNTESQFAAYLQQRGITEDMFLAEMRQNYEMQTVMNRFLLPARVTLFEMWSEYTLQNDELQLEYARIDAEPFRESLVIEESALEDYFTSNTERYRIPPQRRFQYVSAARQRVEEQVSVTDEDARRYWEENKETNPALRSSPKTRARRILLKYPEMDQSTTSTEQRQEELKEILKRAEDLRAQAEAAPDNFGNLANQYSEDDANRETLDTGQVVLKGGELGWIGGLEDRARLGDKLVEAAVTMEEKGKVSDVIQGLDGFSILQAEDFQPSEALPFEGDTIEISRSAVKQRSVREEMDRRIQRLKDAAESSTSLKTVADSAGLEIRESDWIDEGRYDIDPQLGSLVSEDAYIDGLAIGEMSQVLTRTSANQVEGAIVLEPMEKRESRLPSLEEARAKVEADFRAERGLELAGEKAAEALRAAVEPGGLEAWSQAQGYPLETTEFFKRSESPPNMTETIDNLASLTFRMPEGAVQKTTLSFAGEPVGWIVWRIKNLKSPPVGDFSKDYAAFQRSLVELKRMAMYEEWLRDDSAGWDVKIPDDNAE